MQRIVLEIANLPISFESHRLALEQSLLPFISQKAPQLRTRHLFSEPPPFRKKKLFYQRGKTYWFYRTEKGFLIETNPSALGEEFKAARRETISEGIPKAIFLDFSFKEALFFLGPQTNGGSSFYLLWPYVYLLISHLLLYKKKGFFVHASGIRYKKRGVIFVGPSGAGKSTVARLLGKKENISVLGDDVITVVRAQKSPHLYGTPIFNTPSLRPSKEKTSLRAIFFLKHGPKNTLKRLSPRESLRRLLAETPPIPWVPEGLSFSAEFSLDLCTSFPAYELSFLPDASVVSFLTDFLSSF